MLRFTFPLLLAVTGLILFGQGTYIHAKALPAQRVLPPSSSLNKKNENHGAAIASIVTAKADNG